MSGPGRNGRGSLHNLLSSRMQGKIRKIFYSAPCSCGIFAAGVSNDMVYFSSAHSRYTRTQRIYRVCIGALAIALIVYLLSLIPYDILREERFRLYGEAKTTGVVLETSGGGDSYQLAYKFVDQDGFARTVVAPVPKDIWQRYHPGNRIYVFYPRSQPGLSRIEGEIEPPFQVWLRNVLN